MCCIFASPDFNFPSLKNLISGEFYQYPSHLPGFYLYEWDNHACSVPDKSSGNYLTTRQHHLEHVTLNSMVMDRIKGMVEMVTLNV